LTSPKILAKVVVDPVKQASRYQRRWIAVLVCFLAVGVFTLASLAKCSQYRAGSHSESYFAKATKMSGDRCQTSAAVEPPIVLHIRPCEFTAHVTATIPDPILPQAVFLDSFRIRPPPSRVA
jgi:hypothetical protein